MSYKRDGRSPVPKDEKVSRAMSANKASNTGPERRIRKALSAQGVRGYRLHPKNVPGRPDITFIGKKVAVFIHGCYWHRCPTCDLPLPKSNKVFWKKKFVRNQARDAEKAEVLQNAGWEVLTVWECEIKRNPLPAVRRIQARL